MTDYRVYTLTQGEKRKYYVIAGLILASLGFLFYKSLWLSILCMLLARPFEKEFSRYKGGLRREVLLEGFRDVLYSISGSIAAGRQMPTAIADAHRQLTATYGACADISLELLNIVRVYEGAHGSVEDLLLDFGKRSGLVEILQFGRVYHICRHNGGDMEEVALKSANLLLDRISFRGEVKMLTAQKKLDILFLVSMPVAILFFLSLTSSDYLTVLYVGLPGRLIMTLCLIAIAIALVWSLRLTQVNL
jgi:tight adherence protein B